MAGPNETADGRPIILIAVNTSSLLADLRAALESDYRLVTCAPSVAAVRQLELLTHLVVIEADADPQGVTQACRHIRSATSTPIVAVGSSAEGADVARALNEGADDYVAAPFARGELAARIRALLRRAVSADDQRSIVAGPLTVDTARHVALLDGHDLPLTATQFALLAMLARNRDCVVPRQDLLARIGVPDTLGAQRVLRVAISRLRGKLRSQARDDVAIDAVGRVGYQLVVRRET